jgi:hypothetical protein
MARILDFRRIEKLEKIAGETSWVTRLSDAELYALCLTYGTAEHPACKTLLNEGLNVAELAMATEPEGFNFDEMLADDAVRFSNDPDFLDETLDELQTLGAPKAAALLVEAVKAERLSAPYLWPDWRKGLSDRVLEMLDGEQAKG